MPSLDANLDMDPSDISDLDEQNTVEKPEVSDPAASSPATGETDTDLLSVARDAISKERAKSETASPADGENDDLADEPKKPDDEEYSDVPFNKHPRFQHLLRKAKTYEQDAVRYRNVEGFLSERGLAADEAADALTIAGLMKTNPRAAWERLKPTVTKLLIAAGEILPDDLKQRVHSGELSNEAAAEISRARATQTSVQAEREFEVQQRQRTEQSSLSRSLMEAAQGWEDDRERKDPNYAAKREAIEKEVIWLQKKDGVPNSPQGVRAQLAKAYKTVNDNFRPAVVANPRPAVKPVIGGQVAGNQRPGNMSTLDIIRAQRQG